MESLLLPLAGEGAEQSESDEGKSANENSYKTVLCATDPHPTRLRRAPSPANGRKIDAPIESGRLLRVDIPGRAVDSQRSLSRHHDIAHFLPPRPRRAGLRGTDIVEKLPGAFFPSEIHRMGAAERS